MAHGQDNSLQNLKTIITSRAFALDMGYDVDINVSGG
jgi:hypothetical protein